ncbi:aldo/keto reductase [Oceaniovalibus guishaninsula JLT2003]|uniref:Aldo/keto reductase n=1 Tax=Oceaniovalibus guishaninsula JLT2003 TaxID=1231392 RepID=K2HEA0_9RHOB|nr:aldo/keto reductase [Oceaniovalibus guishaninsula]EKE45793.1 aldo/keto reductase [Oceaniovalibus guishaninsula JLT2003]
MERIQLGDISVSRIVYGMWRLGDDADTSPGHVRAKIEACLDQGITTLDQADIYGGYRAEELLGAALTPALRDRVEIVTKCGIVAPMGRHSAVTVKHYDTSRAHIEASIDASLRAMGIDTIDLLLIHRPDPMMDRAETGGALDDAVRSGKVRAVGVSNFRPWDFALLQGAMETPLVTNQIELSLACLDPFTNGDLAAVQERGLRPMAWSPLGGGALMTDAGPLQAALDAVAEEQGTDRAAVAVAWLLAHPAGIVPVMGTNSPERIARIGQAARVTMDRQTWFRLYTLALGHEVA